MPLWSMLPTLRPSGNVFLFFCESHRLFAARSSRISVGERHSAESVNCPQNEKAPDQMRESSPPGAFEVKIFIYTVRLLGSCRPA